MHRMVFLDQKVPCTILFYPILLLPTLKMNQFILNLFLCDILTNMVLNAPFRICKENLDIGPVLKKNTRPTQGEFEITTISSVL